jgi:hypothetical protein
MACGGTAVAAFNPFDAKAAFNPFDAKARLINSQGFGPYLTESTTAHHYTGINWLMQITEIIAVHSESHTKLVNTK